MVTQKKNNGTAVNIYGMKIKELCYIWPFTIHKFQIKLNDEY